MRELQARTGGREGEREGRDATDLADAKKTVPCYRTASVPYGVGKSNGNGGRGGRTRARGGAREGTTAGRERRGGRTGVLLKYQLVTSWVEATGYK